MAPADGVVDAAVERAARLAGKVPETVTGIKRGLYADTVERLHLPIAV